MTPAHQKLGQEGLLEVQGHPQMPDELEDSLGSASD